MRGIGGIVGLLIVLGIGYFVYRTQLTQGTGTQATPKTQIDLIRVRSELLSLAQSERLYLARNGNYATLDQLQQASSAISGSRGYTYNIEVDDGQHFKITATPSDPMNRNLPTFSIDETMQILEK
ncbi:MAG TPA: type IV pilin protein [Acidobacteriota bacterium]|jgi:hypothetical protein